MYESQIKVNLQFLRPRLFISFFFESFAPCSCYENRDTHIQREDKYYVFVLYLHGILYYSITRACHINVARSTLQDKHLVCPYTIAYFLFMLCHDVVWSTDIYFNNKYVAWDTNLNR